MNKQHHHDDLARHMERVARALLGDPNPRLSNKKELRFGTNGSLSIDLTKGTFYDFEACVGGGVLDLIKREKGLVGKAAIDFMRQIGCDVSTEDDSAAKRRLVQTFDYCDADGALVFQVCRYQPKQFIRRRPDGNGGWIWKGGPPLPYRLPELAEAITLGHPVFIVEGERKADALVEWNIVATCNAGGAKKWTPDHAQCLRGADVTILPDNDQSGRDHADIVGASLQGIAANVRLLELPGLGPKGDVINWIETGTTAKQFWQLVEAQARPWKSYADEEQPETSHSKAGRGGVSLGDFFAYMPMHNYIYAPAREPWPASSVNARIPPVLLVDNSGKPILDDKGEPQYIPASRWLDQNKPVEQMTWAPGLPMIIRDKLISQGGWIDRNGVSCFNLYRAPMIQPGNAAAADPWLDHIHKIYPDDLDHIVRWLAHRVQRPEEKINHALVLGGAQGVGKDTLLEPVKYAVGPWNFSEVSPQHMLGCFNGFLKSVILRINEARDLGDFDRYAFYDHTKAYMAAPPDVLRVNEKNLREYSVLNCLAVAITTNHKTDGIFLPADDRRHYVAWTDLTKGDFVQTYWDRLWGWYRDGGIAHVAAYLTELDLTSFDAKAPPPKTQAFWEIVDSSRTPEDAELLDVIDMLGSPAALTLTKIAGRAQGDFAEWLRDRKHFRQIPHRLEACGYVAVRNDAAKSDGLWKIDGKRQVIYAKAELALRDRITAAYELVRR